MAKTENPKIAIRTSNGHYLTAINRGGMGEAANHLPIHSDAGKIGAWETFRVRFHSDGFCTIQNVYRSLLDGR